MENMILVLYVGVSGVRIEDIPTYVKKATENITPKTFHGEIIVIPTQSIDIRIECINPEYIVKKSLIEKHTKMINELQKELQNQMRQLKKENNG